MPEMKTYHGSCHCGAIQFEVDTTLDPVGRCNCSLCKRKGAIINRVPQENFRLLKGEDNLGVYSFNTMVAKHYFCKSCGIYTHHQPRTAPEMRGVNVGCLDGVDTFALEDIKLIDGAALSSV